MRAKKNLVHKPNARGSTYYLLQQGGWKLKHCYDYIWTEASTGYQPASYRYAPLSASLAYLPALSHSPLCPRFHTYLPHFPRVTLRRLVGRKLRGPFMERHIWTANSMVQVRIDRSACVEGGVNIPLVG